MTVTGRPARPESGDGLRDKLTPDYIFPSPEAVPFQPPSQQSDVGDPDVSVVMPCLDEEESVADCVRQARGWIDQSGLTGEVVVVDNGSEDASARLADPSAPELLRVAVLGQTSLIIGANLAFGSVTAAIIDDRE